jgi:nicotinate-nucleotide pyrophosphorylase (carboxylating)
VSEQGAAREIDRRPAAVQVDEEAIRVIDLALAEDQGSGDWTSRWTVNARTRARAEIVAKAAGVLAGVAPALAVFSRLDPRVEGEAHVADGQPVQAGTRIASLAGPARAVLTGERVALNLLQHLSGVATVTRMFVEAVEGTGARILDTRKTMPGMRGLEKGAVRAGGGSNHRFGLFDMVLIKDNHLAIAGGVAEAVSRVREQNTLGLRIEVEIRTLEELEIALEADVDRILLDNMSVDLMRDAVTRVKRRRYRPIVEASGNVSLQNVRAIAETGVDEISIGALTHSAPALDFSLRIDQP